MVEPTNELMMRILQDVQDTVRAIQETQRDHSRRFDRVDKRIEELHESMLMALGLAGHANIRHDNVIARLDEMMDRVEKLDDQVEPDQQSPDRLGEMIEAFAVLSKEEQDRQLAVVETAIREGRL